MKTIMILCVTSLLAMARGQECNMASRVVGRVKGMGIDLSDPSNVDVPLFCDAVKAMDNKFAKCSDEAARIVEASKTMCRAKQGKFICSTPTEATEQTCKKENRDQVEGVCRAKLFKECVKKGLIQDCNRDEVPADTCDSEETYHAFAKEKPECFLVASRMCKEKKAENNVPKDCTSWFDGCNDCEAADDTSNAQVCGAKKFCAKQDKGRAFCKWFKDGKKCQKDDGSLVCEKDGQEIPQTIKENRRCDDLTSRFDVTTGNEDICKKVLVLCGQEENPEIVANCELKKDNDFAQKCIVNEDKDTKTDEDKRKRARCCVRGKLSGESSCKGYGGADALPDNCATSCVENGELKKDMECRRCRGKDGLRLKGLKEGDDSKRPFDPAREQKTIREIVSELSEDGEKCFKRVAESSSLIKTQIQRWRNDPSQEEDAPEDLTIKSVADVQAELDDMAEASASLEDEFAADEAGVAFRQNAGNADQVLTKISDDNKPKKCGDEFAALKTAYNEIVDEYKGIPQTLKEEGVERVSLNFEERDIGSTDLKDTRSVCRFASKLVGRLKKAEGNHKKRLDKARKVVCINAGKKLLNGGLLNKLTTCLRAAKKAADKGTDEAEKQDIRADIAKFDNNGFQRVDKLVRLMKQKCLMKSTSVLARKLARVTNLLKGKLKTKIAKKTWGPLTKENKQAIADRISAAVLAKHAGATNIETSFQEDNGRRQLRPRGLQDTVDVETTYDLDTPAKTADTVTVDLGSDLAEDFDVIGTDASFEPSATIEVMAPVQEIDTQLPTGDVTTGGEVIPSPTDGAQGVVFGAAAVIATLAFA